MKRYLTRSVKEVFSIFKEQNPGVKVSRAKLYSLRPKWVIIYPFSDVCVCAYCANFDLLLTSLKNVTNQTVSQFKDYIKQILSLVCSTQNNVYCYLQGCEKCPGKAGITLESLGLETLDLPDEITFALWKKINLIKKTESIEIYFEELRSSAFNVCKHKKVKELQQAEIIAEKNS